MDGELISKSKFSLVIPIIILSIFIYAARRAHLQQIERIRKMDKIYHIQTNSKTSHYRQ